MGFSIRLMRMPFDGPMSYSKSNGVRDGVVIMTLAGPLTLRNIFQLQKDIAVDPPPVLIFDQRLNIFLGSRELIDWDPDNFVICVIAVLTAPLSCYTR